MYARYRPRLATILATDAATRGALRLEAHFSSPPPCRRASLFPSGLARYHTIAERCVAAVHTSRRADDVWNSACFAVDRRAVAGRRPAGRQLHGLSLLLTLHRRVDSSLSAAGATTGAAGTIRRTGGQHRRINLPHRGGGGGIRGGHADRSTRPLI